MKRFELPHKETVKVKFKLAEGFGARKIIPQDKDFYRIRISEENKDILMDIKKSSKGEFSSMDDVITSLLLTVAYLGDRS